MSNSENLEKEFKDVEKAQRQCLKRFIQEDFLGLIGNALMYLKSGESEENETDDLLSAFTEEQKQKILEYAKSSQQTLNKMRNLGEDEAVSDEAGKIMDDISFIYEFEQFDSITLFEKLKKAMNCCNSREIEALCEKNEKFNPLLVGLIRENVFIFEDLVLLDDRNIQKVLRECDQQNLEIALKGTTDEVQEKILRNMSRRAASMLKEDMEFMGPVFTETVFENQEKIVKIVKNLIEKGEVLISSGNNSVVY